MSNSDRVYEILQTVWVPECSLVGNENVRAIADGASKYVGAHGGSSIDLTSVFDVLASACTVVSCATTCYLSLKQQSQNDDVPVIILTEATIQALSKEREPAIKIENNQVQKVCEEIVKQDVD